VRAWGSTVGQRAVGVRVVREEDPGGRLPLSRSLLRALVWWGPWYCRLLARHRPHRQPDGAPRPALGGLRSQEAGIA
jgi:hypothetical protein